MDVSSPLLSVCVSTNYWLLSFYVFHLHQKLASQFVCLLFGAEWVVYCLLYQTEYLKWHQYPCFLLIDFPVAYTNSPLQHQVDTCTAVVPT